MSQLLRSSELHKEPKQLKPWLLKHYEVKRQRTVTLVKAVIDQLVPEQQTVTIEAICRKSLELDLEAGGSKSQRAWRTPRPTPITRSTARRTK